MVTLAQRMCLPPGTTVCPLRAPDRHRPLLLADADEARPAAFVVLYSRSRAQLERDAAGAIAATRDGATLWVCYPKRSARTPSDMSRTACRELMLGRGWRAGKQVALDDVWTAIRFTRVRRFPAPIVPQAAGARVHPPRKQTPRTATF